MSRTLFPRLAGGLIPIVAVLLLSSPDLIAQSVGNADTGGPAGAELRAEALEAVAGGAHLGRIARRLALEAADLPVDHLERARTLQLAGRLHWHDGDFDRARRVLTRAGIAAHAAGESKLAVQLFLDAAQAAVADGKNEAAWLPALRAGYVIRTADFTSEERIQLLARITYADQPPLLETVPPLAKQ